MNSSATIVWFRQDLRLEDNPTLTDAIARGNPIVPLFIWAPEEEGPWRPGGASRWWLHHSLDSLRRDLEALGSRLIIRRGPALPTLRAVIKETGADAIYFNRRIEPEAVRHEKRVVEALGADGVEVSAYCGNFLFEPEEILSNSKQAFRIFTPFSKVCRQIGLRGPSHARRAGYRAYGEWQYSLQIEDLGLLPKVDWAGGIRETWRPGERGAHRRLDCFIENAIEGYAENRNRPDIESVSMLSPHLHFGEISPRQIVGQVQARCGNLDEAQSGGVKSFVRQLLWREFGNHLLHHYPETTEAPLYEKYAAFPWRDDAKALNAWKHGQTGYPMVDAGMRQLWHTGFMHNRLRMVVGSFLVKDLLLPWQEGAKWFWDTLVDADLANNTLGWQWVAGCGADAAPYFRVFHPVKQGETFDPDGTFVRKWVPELRDLPSEWIHRPWEAPVHILEFAGVQLGKSYPWPIVDHDTARRRALEALATIRVM